MKRILNGSILIAMVALVLAACGGGGGGGGGIVTPPAPPTLTSISLSPSNPNLALNALLHLTIVGNYSNGTTANLYGAASWVSSASAVADVDSTGAVTPAGTAGQTASISVTYNTLSASTTVTLAPALTTYSVTTVTDPLASEQWGLRNTAQFAFSDTSGVANTGTLGTDIHVDSVYSSYGNTGAGVTVAVVDTGLEIAHEDMTNNVVTNGSWDFANSDTDPTTSATTGDHGTSVSGLIAMQKGNAIGGMGVAPSARLKGFNFLSPAAGYVATSLELAQSLGGSSASPNSTDVDVFNQSFGTANAEDFPVDSMAEAQYAYGATSLRGGKGALYVKSAGNGFRAFGSGYCAGANALGVSCQNANFDPSNTLPYNIVMAALNAKGKRSSYSTAGSAVWVSTPGGEYGYNVATAGTSASWPASIYDPAMVTADQSGCTNGYSRTATTASSFNQGGTNLASINLNCNYANTMNGTSSAAPMMSGVIALILEANPSLTWRDVKDILAKTAVQVDAAIAPVTLTLGNGTSYTAEQAWTTNAASFKFHNWYGFGAVDAAAAVTMARTYVPGTMGTFASTGWVSSGALSIAIPDDSTVGASVGLTVPKVGSSGKVETVQIKVTTTAGWTGDLGIEVISPSGTRSVLKNIMDGFTGTTGLNGMVLASNAFYGENNTGNWTVKVVDGWSGFTQTLTNVQIRVYGH